jgi:WW domain-containing oxidoreductase
MASSVPHGARSTANQVLAGVDLTRKWILVTGCNEEIGFETMSALAANGAHVFGLANSLASAKNACDQIGPRATPVACDLADLDSVAAAAEVIRGLEVSLDAIIANSEVASPPTLHTRYGVELQFFSNHIGHFTLVNQLLGLVRNGTGRIVMVSSSASVMQAPPEGIMFDNLDGHRHYKPSTFYGQSKLANALYAKELSRRLSSRGIAVNSVDPGAARTRINTGFFARLFARSAARAAATQAFVSANPQASGITGQFWSDCRISKGSPLLQDAVLARRLWEVSEEIIAGASSRHQQSMQRAA